QRGGEPLGEGGARGLDQPRRIGVAAGDRAPELLLERLAAEPLQQGRGGRLVQERVHRRGMEGRGRRRHGSFTIGEAQGEPAEARGGALGRGAGGPLSSSNVERDLRTLEEALRRLNAEYDAFLYGSASKPPIQNRKAVEEMFRRLNAFESLPAAE